MMNLRPHRRVQIPNSLAIFAALLLLISSVAGFETNQEAVTFGPKTKVSVRTEDSINNAVKSKSRGLKLGLLLFRRG